MAENYILFSCELFIDAESRQWCENYLLLAHDIHSEAWKGGLDLEDEDHAQMIDAFLEETSFDRSILGTPLLAYLMSGDGSVFDYEVEEGRVWMFTEEGVDPYSTALFAQAYLQRWNPSGCFTMTWAETCSKPRVGEFTGGYCFVTADEIITGNATTLANELAAAFIEGRRRLSA